MRWAFGESELDTERFELRRGGKSIPVQRKVFDLIRYLVEHRDRAVTKQELFEKVWSGVHVSESALAWGVSQARKALGQSRAEATPIETLHGRGYRFRAEVVLVESAGDRHTLPFAPLSGETTAQDLPFVGRVAVMEQLGGLLSDAARGAGTLIMLVGDPGIGKTRCAEEFVKNARAGGVRTFWGACWEGEGAHAFWPWIQVVRSCANDEAIDASARKKAEALLEMLRSRGAGSGGGIESEHVAASSRNTRKYSGS